MKKKVKKLLTLVFAVVMTACTVVLAFAAEPKEDTASPNALTSMTFDSGTEYTLGWESLPVTQQSAFVTQMIFYAGLNSIDYSAYIKWTANGPNWYGENCAVKVICRAIYKRSDHYAGDFVEKESVNYFTFPRVGSESVPYSLLKDSINLTSVHNSGTSFDGWSQFYTRAYFYRGYENGDPLPGADWQDDSMLDVPYSEVKQLDS